MPRDPASYRDPAGHVHVVDERIYRTVRAPGREHYERARDSGFLARASASGRLIGGQEVDRDVLRGEDPEALYVLEHPRLPFISYPYCWSFGALRAAALLTIDLHLDALEGSGSADLAAALPFRAKLHPLVAAHVVLQGRLQQSMNAERTTTAKKVRLSKTALQNNLRSMRSFVAGLTPPASQQSPWQQYEHTAHYTADERSAKARFVGDVIAAAMTRVVWDLGCNSGEYSEIALHRGAGTVIGFEPD